MQKYMKLSDYAEKYNVTYKTAWNRYKQGKIKKAFVDETGHIIIPIDKEQNSKNYVALYARVSSNDRKESLNNQLEKLKSFATNKGLIIKYTVKEIGSGMNDKRKKLNNLLEKDDWDILIIENKDRLTRFGFNYIKLLLKKLNKELIVINETDDNKKDLMQDLISIIYSFSAKMYGLRRRKKKEEIITFLKK